MAGRFLGELKRRNVIRVGGVYAVTAWALFQIAKTIFEVMSFPKWTSPLLLVLLALGLPFAMIISWAFERAPEGGVRRVEGPPPDAPAPKLTVLDAVLLAALAGVIGISVAQMTGVAPRPEGNLLVASAPEKSVAVLPFAAFSAEPDTEYFADGLTEEVINSLAQVDDLKVAGRTSAFYFKGKNEDLREVGKKLGVAHVVEGSVRRSGDKLRVTAQLISVDDGFHLWSETFDREMDDAFAIQTEIAQAVAEALKTSLRSEAAALIGQRDPEAYELQLSALAHLRRMTLADLQTSRSQYERLTTIDPENPAAWAGYARATMLIAQNYLALDFNDAWKASDAAIEKAMSLDANSVDAWLARAYLARILWVRLGESRWGRVEEQAIRRVLALDPKNPEGHTLNAVYQMQTGRPEQAVEAAKKSLALDPLDRLPQVLLANALRDTGRLDEAAAQYRAVIDFFPDYDDAKENLGALLVEQGRLAQAEPWLRTNGLSGDDPAAALDLGHLYVNLGLLADAEKALSSVKTPPGSAYLEAARLAALDRYPEVVAFAKGKAAVDDDPFWPQALVIGQVMTGDWSDAVAQLPKYATEVLTPEPDIEAASPLGALTVATVLSNAGDRAQARRIAEAVLRNTQPRRNGYLSNNDRIARVKAYGLLGDKERALTELAGAVQNGWRTPFEFENYMPIERDPAVAILHADPRFQQLLGQVRADLASQRQAVLAQRR